MRKIITIALILIIASCKNDEKFKVDFKYSIEDLTVTFSNLSIGAKSYEWNFGDDSISTEKSPVYTYKNYGEYTVTLKALNGNEIDSKSEVFTLVHDPNDGLKRVMLSESDQIIINPERGFYNHFTGSGTNSLTVSSVKTSRNSGISLWMTIYYLTNFRESPISDEFLDNIRANMINLREGGSKCILRFAYTNRESDDTKPWDAPKELVLRHIEQLTPILQEFSDVIYVMEAGFIGVWGEWYYTDYFGMGTLTEENFADRRAVLDDLLKALPDNRMVCIRAPFYKLRCYNIEFADSITIETAYNRSNLSRLAAHNDCFLASSNDVGTFRGNNDRDFWASETKYVVMGGETCGVQPPYSLCENAVKQMERFHWSYLNSRYHTGVLNSWINDGCMDDIKKKVGYRFVLNEIRHTAEPKVGAPLELKFYIRNKGWATPANPRDVEIILISKNDENEKYTFKLQEDPRYWFAGERIILKTVLNLPSSMKPGDYEIFLNLPDPESTLKNRPEYSIQLANEGVWVEETGFNKICTIMVNG